MGSMNSPNRPGAQKLRRAQFKRVAALLYCALFLLGSVAFLVSLSYRGVSGMLLAAYTAAFFLFCRALLLLQSDAQPRRRKNDLIDELNQTKTHMQKIQLQKRQEQLNALQSQINPHFLYNTLDTIRGLAIEKESFDIANIVAALASMFKYSMDYASTNVALNDELAHLEQYVKIQTMRFPGMFTVERIYECGQDALFEVNMPKMTLQPIVENAISHGLKNRIGGGGRITLRFVMSDADFKVILSDNGTGIPEDMVLALNDSFRRNDPESTMQDPSRFGIALSNIDSRIKIYCGQAYGLFIASTPGVGTEVTVRLPAPKTQV